MPFLSYGVYWAVMVVSRTNAMLTVRGAQRPVASMTARSRNGAALHIHCHQMLQRFSNSSPACSALFAVFQP